MWFGGLELSFIYERHIALQEMDNIFKWVKRGLFFVSTFETG